MLAPILLASAVLAALIVVLYREGREHLGRRGDPVSNAANLCFLVGALSALLVLLAGSLFANLGVPEGGDPRQAQRLRQGLVFLLLLLAGEGGLYVGLGFGILRESRACAYAAAILYTVSTLLSFGQGGIGCGVIRALIVIALWKAVWEIGKLNEADLVAAERRAKFEEERAERERRPHGSPRPRPLAAPAPEVSPERATGRGKPVQSFEEFVARKTARQERRPAPEPEAEPVELPHIPQRLCPNCRASYDAPATTCQTCRVALFDA